MHKVSLVYITSRWHSRGQRFDPAYLHHLVLKTIGFQDFFFCNSGISPVLGWFFNHPATWHFRATRQHESNMNQDDFTNWSTRAWVSPWRFEKGDPSGRIFVFVSRYFFRDDRLERARRFTTTGLRVRIVSFRAVGTSFEDAERGARNLLFRTAFGLSFGKDSFFSLAKV